MLTKRIAGGAALVLSLSATLRMARGQVSPGPAQSDPLRAAGALAGSGGVRAAGDADGGAGKAAYLAGKRASTGDERERHFASGVAATRAQLQARPDDPAALLWLAANLGAGALERGKLTALRVLPEMERLLLRLESVAPSFDHAAGARTLARLYHKAPALISIGSMKKARIYWERALSRAGDYPANLILAADFFHDEGDQTRARQLAERYLANPVSPQENPEASEWREIAERLVRRSRR